CLCAANAWLSYHSMRLYVEQLTTLLTLATVLLVVGVSRAPRSRTGVALGAAVGLGLLAKQSSLVRLALVVALWALGGIRRRTDQERGWGLGAFVALVFAAAMFVRNAILYGSPIYPAFAPDLDPLLYRLNAAQYTPPARNFYFAMALYIGPAIGAFVLT